MRAAGEIRICTEVYGYVRRCTDMYGGVRICTEAYGGITIKSEVVFSPYPSVPPESYGGGSVPIRTTGGLQSEKPDPKKAL